MGAADFLSFQGAAADICTIKRKLTDPEQKGACDSAGHEYLLDGDSIVHHVMKPQYFRHASQDAIRVFNHPLVLHCVAAHQAINAAQV